MYLVEWIVLLIKFWINLHLHLSFYLKCKVSALRLKLFSQFSVVTPNCQILLCKCEKVWKDTGSLCFWLHLIMYITYNPSYPFFLPADSTCSKFHSEGSQMLGLKHYCQNCIRSVLSISEIVCIVLVSPQWWSMWVRSDFRAYSGFA